MDEVVDITTKEEFHEYLRDNESKLIMVDFYAEWCGPCRQISPEIKKIANEMKDKGMEVLKVDVDKAADLAQECDIQCMPTFQFYKNGKKVDEFSGANNTKLREVIDKLLKAE